MINKKYTNQSVVEEPFFMDPKPAQSPSPTPGDRYVQGSNNPQQQYMFQQPQQQQPQPQARQVSQQPQQQPQPQQPQQQPQSQQSYQPQRASGVQPVLEVVGLTKKYGERYAVDNISFKMMPGQIVGFLGANGAGKSTTIKMLTGLAKITSGDAYICGRSVADGFENAIKNVGAMIETPIFYPYLSGLNNLRFFAKLSGNIKDDRINYVATLVGLGNRIKDKVGNYSLGMKQRLGVAQALLSSPKVLILDEPTNGLDANGIREFRMMLKQLAHKEGISILISSHILGEMENLCDNIIIIDKGKIIQVSTMEQIKHNSNIAGSQFIKCNAPNFAGKLIKQMGINVKIQGNKVYVDNPQKEMLSQIIVTLTQNRILVYGAGDVDYSLEDVFLNIINRYNSNTSIS